VRSIPRLYNEDQLRLREGLQKAVRRVVVSCETLATKIREYGSRGSYCVRSRYQATTDEDTADRRFSTSCSELQIV
jgi:hypothetical protein